MFDFKNIWNYLVPDNLKKFVKKIEDEIKTLDKDIKKTFKRADSLAASVPEQKRSDISGKDDGIVEPEQQLMAKTDLFANIKDQLMAVFNYNYDNQRPDGFRNKRIIEYENRIRSYSNPDKIFRYFATIKIVHVNQEVEIFMTPHDFLRALTPGIRQPDGYGLDQFEVIDLSKDSDGLQFNTLLDQPLFFNNEFKTVQLKEDSIFYKLSKHGLINYSDFLFLLTVISVSSRNFAIAFRMFDLNCDGQVEYREFAKVQNAILSQTSVGKKLGKAVRYKGIGSAVSKYFFGDDLKQPLTIEKFLMFQDALQKELLTLEFERKNPDPTTGKIHDDDFADLLLTYALFTEKKRKRLIKRVLEKFPNNNDNDNNNNNGAGISLDEYLNFYHFLQHIQDVDIALAVYNIAGASIDQATMKHAAKAVAQVNLSDHLIDVIFTIFDEDEDGELSHKEFIAIMKERLRRGLSKPKDTSFFAILLTIWKSIISVIN